MIYTVGIQMGFFRLLRKFRVSFHEFEGDSKVVLTLADGSMLVVPGLDRKVFKIYPDYRDAKEKFEQAQAEPTLDEYVLDEEAMPIQ